MVKKINIRNQGKVEDQLYEFMEKFWEQSNNKKVIARMITFVVIAFAIFQELYTESFLSDGWCEITIYLLLGYFGMAGYRSIFRDYFKI
jgi:hypothetical protein